MYYTKYAFPPLVKRVVKDRSKFVESKLSTISGAYRFWDTISMQKAVKAVEEGMPLRQAAEIFFVPKSSLHDRVTGKIDFGAYSGPRTYLSYEEEEIPSFLIHTAKIGYTHTQKQVMALVQKTVDGEVPGTLYGLSDSRWMTRELFNYWFTEHFLLYAPQIRLITFRWTFHSLLPRDNKYNCNAQHH